MKTFLKIYAPYLIIAGAIVASGLIVAGVSYAQTTPNITFPIQELGGCTNKQSCQAYCDISAHKLDCVSFAETHGLMSSDDASRARKFLQAGSGPGGCTGEDSCRAYCSDTSHINECVAFAKKTGLVESDELNKMDKIASALQSGAKLPGGCTTKDSCEAYCSDSAHLNECVAFAKEAGIMGDKEADIVLKTGGKGPGGCNSKDSCESYCNQKDHANECFNFAKEHGLIPEEQLKNLQRGVSQMRIGLSNAPGEVVQCLKDKFGTDIVGRIESGSFIPGPEDGQKIQACFGEFKGQMMEKMQQGFKEMPKAADCIKEKLGSDVLEHLKQGAELDDPEKGDEIRECFTESAKAFQQQMFQQMQSQWQSMPPAVQGCVTDELGADRLGRIKSGQGTAEDQKEVPSVVQKCMSKLQEQMREQMKEQINEHMQLPGRGGVKNEGENETQRVFTPNTMMPTNPLLPGFNAPSGGFGPGAGGVVPAPQQPANIQR